MDGAGVGVEVWDGVNEGGGVQEMDWWGGHGDFGINKMQGGRSILAEIGKSRGKSLGDEAEEYGL